MLKRGTSRKLRERLKWRGAPEGRGAATILWTYWRKFKLHRITCWHLSIHWRAKTETFTLVNSVKGHFFLFFWYSGSSSSAWWCENYRSMSSSLLHPDSVQNESACSLSAKGGRSREPARRKKPPFYSFIYIYITHIIWTITWLNGPVKWNRLSP